MFEQLLFYFLPLWVSIGFYFSKIYTFLSKPYKVILISTFVIVLASPYLVSVVELFKPLGFFNTLTWWFLTIICFYSMKVRGYSLIYAVFISLTAMFLTTEIWEIPIHMLTISMNLTLDQIIRTFMLSSPYLFLFLPLVIELKRYKTLEKPWGLIFVAFFIALPILVGVAFFFEAGNSLIFQANGYPNDMVNYVLRAVWAVMMFFIICRFPRVKV